MKPKTIRSLKSSLWFLVKLNILAVPLFLAVHFGASVPQFQDIWAALLNQSLSSLGYETVLNGHIIGLGSEGTIYQIEFSWDSTGWKSLYAMTILVFASGVGSLSGKLRFLAFALPLIFFINFFRVVSTILVSLAFGFEVFDFVHTFLWGSMMVVLVVAIWYAAFLKNGKTKN